MIAIRQSDLIATGFGQVQFAALDRNARKQVSAQVLRRLGRSQEARLLEMNNMLAISSIRFIDDVPARIRF